MKLATLKGPGRDGRLVVVSADLARAVEVSRIAPTLQAALDDWAALEPALRRAAQGLEEGEVGREDVFPFDPAHCASPLPRAYQFADGSAYLNHVALVRRARGAELPAELLDDPLMYQAASDGFLGPTDPIAVADEAFGIDLEAEVAVITDDVPMDVAPEAARGHVKLVMLLNDVSLRRLIPGELAKGFGFFQGKPRSACSPVAVTPDALGRAWREGKLHGALRSTINGAELGHPDAGVEMQFDFGRLIAHAARTRPLAAGTIVGSGTVSNQDPAVGSSCLAEVRTIETLEHGKATTGFLKFGDRVRIEMLDAGGRSIFGAIDQEVLRYEVARLSPVD
jgi:fumarylacetoacetate (FAA) hydrolase